MTIASMVTWRTHRLGLEMVVAFEAGNSMVHPYLKLGSIWLIRGEAQ
jgi:hypothetical protein